MNDYQSRGFSEPVPPPFEKPPEKPQFVPRRPHASQSQVSPIVKYAILGCAAGVLAASLWTFLLIFMHPLSEPGDVEFMAENPGFAMFGFMLDLTTWIVPFALIGGAIGAFFGSLRPRY